MLSLLLGACTGGDQQDAATAATLPLVVVGNEPVRTLVDRLAGGLVRCELPVPLGEIRRIGHRMMRRSIISPPQT